MRVALANGCFDLLHAGHIAHLKEARGMADFLVVALTMDEFVGKPGRPIYDWDTRAEMLRELRCVGAVSAAKNAVEAILQWKPTLFVKGIDYAEKGLLPEELDACFQVGAKVKFTTSEKRSTTQIVENVRKQWHGY